ncbi:MAG: hypothetical protein ACTSYF_14180 [Promethearchaeota archaeon]
MFKGKFSTLKNIIYLMILGLHAFLFAYFIYITLPDYVITIISSLSIASLIILGFYSFLTTKSYYFYFYIGIIISSTPLIFMVHLSAILIVPELIILFMLMYRGLTTGETYIKIYEAGLTNIPTNLTTTDVMPRNLSIRSEDKRLENKTFSKKMQILCFLLTVVSLISFAIYVRKFIS